MPATAVSLPDQGEAEPVRLARVEPCAAELAIADCPDGARTRPCIVNLNHPALVAARAAALDSERIRLERAFKDTKASRDEREKRATEILAQEALPAFVSIRVTWLRQRLGRGR